jgi:hypothetical protein
MAIDRCFFCAVDVLAAGVPNQVVVRVLKLAVLVLLFGVYTVEKAFVVDDTIDQAKQETERDGKRMSLKRKSNRRCA